MTCADRLYFDELSFERVLDVIDLEQPRGVIVWLRPDTQQSAMAHRQSVPVSRYIAHINRPLGKSHSLPPCSISSASTSRVAGAHKPWKTPSEFVDKVGYPAVPRASLICASGVTNVCYNEEELANFPI